MVSFTLVEDPEMGTPKATALEFADPTMGTSRDAPKLQQAKVKNEAVPSIAVKKEVPKTPVGGARKQSLKSLQSWVPLSMSLRLSWPASQWEIGCPSYLPRT